MFQLINHIALKYSCQDITIDTSGRPVAYCWAAEACTNANIHASDAYCTAQKACELAHIDSSVDAHCGGTFGCVSAYVEANNNIYCKGKYGCSRGEYHTTTIQIDAWFGAARADIYANTIKGNGYKSLSAATIDSKGRNTMTVQAYGHQAGDGATMICRSRSECSLECSGSGCLNMEYVCIDGAVCNITPLQCDGTKTKYKGIDCPTRTTAVSDKDVENIMERKMKLYERLENHIDDLLDGLYDEDGDEEEYYKYDTLELMNETELMINNGILMGFDDKIILGIGCVVFLVSFMVYRWHGRNTVKDGYQALL